MFELHSVERACQGIPGGLKKLVMVDPLDLATQPTWNIAQDAGELNFLPGKSAYTFEGDKLNARLTGDTNTGSQGGDYIEYRLTATVRAIRPTIESLRAKLMNRRIHMVVTYQYGLKRFLPYIRLSASEDSGSRYSDKQGYSFQGITRLLSPGAGVSGNIAEVVPPTTDPVTPDPGTGATMIELGVSTATYTYTIPAGKWLVGWEVKGSSAQEVSLGLSPLGYELGGPVPLLANQPWAGSGNNMATFISTPIYFSGMTGTNTIRVWLLG